MPTLSAQNVVFRYSAGFALKQIDLSIQEKSFLGLIGPNGSGKTTLLRILSGLLVPESGEVTLDDISIKTLSARELAKKLAVISSEQYFEFPFPVEEIVSMGRFPHLGRFEKLGSGDRKIVNEALELTEVFHLRNRPISHLSSGERQRVLIARAIAQKPSVLMLDEPNAHLDINHQISIFRLLKRLRTHQPMSVVVVLHDLTATAAFCRTVALLSEGRLIKTGTPKEVITTETIRKVYKADVEVHTSPLSGFPQITYSA